MEYELYHYGIKGQKWGVRRYQKADGTLTNVSEYYTQVLKDESLCNSRGSFFSTRFTPPPRRCGYGGENSKWSMNFITLVSRA